MDIQTIIESYKQCSKCHLAQLKTEFNKTRGECKTCRKDFNKNYYRFLKAERENEKLPKECYGDS